MAIYTEESITRVARVTENGIIEVQREDRVLRDGEVINKSYHRSTLSPGNDLTGQDAKVAAVAQAVWALL